MVYQIIARLGRNGGKRLEEFMIGTDDDVLNRIKVLKKQYGGIYSWQLFQDGIKVFDSSWIA